MKIPYNFNCEKSSSFVHASFVQAFSLFCRPSLAQESQRIYREFVTALHQNDSEKLKVICEPKMARETMKALSLARRSGLKTELVSSKFSITSSVFESSQHYFGLFLHRDLNRPIVDYQVSQIKNETFYQVKPNIMEKNESFLEKTERKLKANDVDLQETLEFYGEKELKDLLEKREAQRFEEVTIKISTDMKLVLPSVKSLHNFQKTNIAFENHIMQLGRVIAKGKSKKAKYVLLDFDGYFEGSKF